MCEFKVFVKRGGREEAVAEDIVYAKDEGSSIVLKDVLGNSVKVGNASILEVDVEAERLILAENTTPRERVDKGIR
ncbi:MAG: CooT family nickel-binding protein [Thaumarchaeota archaeon]|nr:CooT family nickel-binding protein [Nitrososphaerota archaeon]MCL5316906.1 CooT family nickel-binding protein [Nitrososphaerota archaeon]